MEILYLLPNTTSHIKPRGARIISALKANYCRLLSFRVFENMNAGAESINNVDVLSAMRWVKEEWIAMPEIFISNCWKQFFDNDSSYFSLGYASVDQRDLREQVLQAVQAHNVK